MKMDIQTGYESDQFSNTDPNPKKKHPDWPFQLVVSLEIAAPSSSMKHSVGAMY